MSEDIATVKDLKEKPEPLVETTYEWKPQDSTAVPEAIKKKYPNSRFRWRGTIYLEEKGPGEWAPVEIDEETRREANLFRWGQSADSLVQRGDTILFHMPEGLAQARERHYDILNLQQEASTKERFEASIQGRTKLHGTVKVDSPRQEPESIEQPEPEAPRGRGRPRKEKE